MSNFLEFRPLLEHPELVSDPVFRMAQRFSEAGVLVAKIDPQYMGGNEFCEQYSFDPQEGANCVIVEVTGEQNRSFAAVVVPVGYRADLNGSVRRLLAAKRVSLAPLEEVLRETGMEYGSITLFGLPDSWKILVDDRLMQKEKIIVGGGKQISKLLLPTRVLRELSNVQIIGDVCKH
jgi:prolyl-tRNA editing enzyme YbaK/EbsC (Cys-tRNA(Pro) deacylase)